MQVLMSICRFQATKKRMTVAAVTRFFVLPLVGTRSIPARHFISKERSDHLLLPFYHKRDYEHAYGVRRALATLTCQRKPGRAFPIRRT